VTQRLDVDVYLEHFRARVLQDALSEATASYWHRRSRAFAAAQTRPGDYPGRVTPTARAARDARLYATAYACRARAALALLQNDVSPEVIDALRQVA
jgi:hypothetical protein